MSRKPSLVEQVRAAWADPAIRIAAKVAYDRFASYCEGRQPRIPGMDTVLRLACRIADGMTIDQAAAREYAYRWHLPLNQMINHTQARSRSKPITGAWRAPHLLGA